MDKMEDCRTKEVLDFLLNAYRAKMSVQNPTKDCPFDFQSFLNAWKDKHDNWDSLRSSIRQDLAPLINEGVFDSIVPYLSSSITKSAATNLIEDEPSSRVQFEKSFRDQFISAELRSLKPGSSAVEEKQHNKEHTEDETCEITIHVCDEARNLKRDFKCAQSLLVKEMGYFSKVAVKGQKLKDMDISVHCDVSVFEWLVKWIKCKRDNKDNVREHEIPTLDVTNVVGLMVSAEFLQMPALTQECVSYTAAHIDNVILKSPNLGCLNESLSNALLKHFSNLEVETTIVRIDRNDRITSRIYTQMILALNNPEPDKMHGNFSSTATLFKCHTCHQLLINSVAAKVPCQNMRLDSRGKLYACHYKDPNWSLSYFIKDLKRELKSWRKVYWRLWATCHFMECSQCTVYFPVKAYSLCQFHPKEATLTININAVTGEILPARHKPSPPKEECINPFRRKREARENSKLEEKVETINCAFGNYVCCNQSAYKFYPLPSTNGCNYQDHVVMENSESAEVLSRVNQLRDLIVVEKVWEQCFEWGGIAELSPQKSTTSTSCVLSFINSNLPRKQPPVKGAFTGGTSTSTDSDEITEDGSSGLDQSYWNAPSSLAVFWSWNSDFTTRYNQDMQREKEEKLMSDLELLLAQRVSLDDSGNTSLHNMRFGYLSKRSSKNVGGTFIRLEEAWKDEHYKNSKAARIAAKSAKN